MFEQLLAKPVVPTIERVALSMSDTERTAVILDPQLMWLEAVEILLDRIGVRVVGKTTHSEEALDLVASRRPSLFITSAELHEDEVDGIECVERALEHHPSMKVLVLS